MSQELASQQSIDEQEKEIQWHINTGGNTIHAKRIPGKFRRIKWMSASIWLLILIGPYLRWGERQAVLLDIPDQQFHFFELTMHPHDVWTLTFVMFFFAGLLLISTIIVGRAFCGYACFQTVWTDLYTWIEEKLEGPPRARYQLDSAPWNLRKIGIKTSKHILWLLIAMLTGVSFAAWFTDAFQLWRDYFSLQAHISAWIVLGLFTLGTYVFAGFMREQVCLWLCPYSRIQGVMYDKNTLLPTYDEQRGEPRVKLDRSTQKLNGDCVDCDQCLAVCPTGVDIREGQQIGCIACGLCVDACDRVMNKINRPTGLIRYASLNQMNKEHAKPMLLRPPVQLSAFVLIVSVFATIYGLSTMSEAELSVSDSRLPMYVILSDNSVQNRYQVRVFNKSKYDQHYRIEIDGLKGIKIKGVEEDLFVKSGQMATKMVMVSIAKTAIKKSLTPLVFSIHNTTMSDSLPIKYLTTFKGPIK